MPVRPPHVVVVGSVNVDLVLRVPTLPAEGETVTGGQFIRTPGGKGANQAAAAARLGARVRLVGMTGRDADGDYARADLAAFGVDTSELGHAALATGVAGIFVDHTGRNAIAVASGANHSLTGADVAAALERIGGEDAVVLANLEVPNDAVFAAADHAARRGWPFVLNPAPARPLPDGLAATCAVITPNRDEAEALGSVDALLAAGSGAVLVTLGADGARLHAPGSEPREFPSIPVDAVDTTGAGDAFNGALAWALASGRDLAGAAQVATVAGALACRSVGARASLPDAAEVAAHLDGPQPGVR